MKRIIFQRLENRKRRLARRLARKRGADPHHPTLTTAGLHYDVAERSRGLAYGGIPLMLRFAEDVGLIDGINQHLNLLTFYRPYRESDHVLNFVINACCEGRCLEDIELRRQDEVFLDAVGARSLPDPTTAGDFCRRFTVGHIRTLQEVINQSRLQVWQQQPAAFFQEAVIDMDGTMVTTSGECKQGMDISYKGTWGYHPLIVSLANTGEILSVVNRSGNRPSEEGAAAEADRAIAVCREGGFQSIRLRGDTAFSQTLFLDSWHQQGVIFQFGYDACPNLVKRADALPEEAWTQLQRPARYQVKTQTRHKPPRVKREIIRQREFKQLELQCEHVAEFSYQPTACSRAYRMIVVRKTIS